MATGDAALAAGMDILTGNEPANTLDTEENKTRDYIATFAAGVRPVAAGGTGADTAAEARSNLDVVGNDQVIVSTSGAAVAGKIPRYDASGRIVAGSPVQPNQAAPKSYVDQLREDMVGRTDAKVDKAGDTMTGPLVLQSAAPVTNGYVSLYRNGDGRVGITPSAQRFKKNIKDRTYTLEQLLAIRVVEYQLRAKYFGFGDGPLEVGVIAEELIEAGLEEFVVFDNDGQTIAVHYERLALVAIGALQDLAARVSAMEARLSALEES